MIGLIIFVAYFGYNMWQVKKAIDANYSSGDIFVRFFFAGPIDLYHLIQKLLKK